MRCETVVCRGLWAIVDTGIRRRGKRGWHARGAACLLVCIVTSGIAGCTAPTRRALAWPPPDDPTLTREQGGIIRGDRSRKVLALVFTGGDYGEGTAAILDALHERRVQASFFLTGTYLAKPEHRELVRRMVREGHYVGPHSHGHLLYCPWEERGRSLVTEAEFAADLEQNIAELRGLGALPGNGPVYFIPPYEWYNADQARWAAACGVVLFNFTPGSGSNRDWIPEGERGFVSSERIRADVLAYEQKDPHGLNGFLLLLHVGSLRADKMHTQVGPLLDELQQRGYTFERVDGLLVRPTTRPPDPARRHSEGA